MKSPPSAPRPVWQHTMLLVLAAAIIVPRLAPVSHFLTIDEHGWLIRSLKFQIAIRQGELVDTYQARHPGVTTMGLGALALLWEFPEAADLADDGIGVGDFEAFLVENGHTPLDLLVKGRLLIVVATTVALLASFSCARRLFGWRTASLAFLLLAFSPFHAAHTQILHVDGLMSSLVLLALLSFLLHLRTRRALHLAISGASAGLAWLTKSPGIFLGPAVALIALFDWFVSSRSALGADRLGARQGVVQGVLTILAWGSIALLVFVAFWPAMWVSPVEVVKNMAEGALALAEHGHPTPIFFKGRVYPEGQLGPLFYPLSYAWRTTPVVSAGLLLGILMFVAWRRELSDCARFSLMGVVIFAAAFLLQLTPSGKKFDRYLLPLYGPLMLIASHGWVEGTSWLTTRMNVGRPPRVAAALLSIVVALQGWTLLRSFPYYLSYFTPLLGGPEAATEVFTVGWGEGLDAAARYLNGKPNATGLRVVSWYSPCLSYFFVGSTLNVPNAADISPEHLDFLLQADYLVSYVHQWQRDIPKSLVHALTDRTPEYAFSFRGIPYAQVYDLHRDAAIR